MEVWKAEEGLGWACVLEATRGNHRAVWAGSLFTGYGYDQCYSSGLSQQLLLCRVLNIFLKYIFSSCFTFPHRSDHFLQDAQELLKAA